MKKCPFCAEEIQDAAVKCKHCGSVLESDTSHSSWGKIKAFPYGTPVEKSILRKKLKPTTSLLLLLIGISIVLLPTLGSMHIITGLSGGGVEIRLKRTFGFKDSFVNVNEISHMPSIVAKSTHPIAVEMLQREGFIESDEHFEQRGRAEFEDQMKKSMKKMDELMKAYDANQ